MTVGELKKLLDKFEDEQTIMAMDLSGCICNITKVVETVTGPKIYTD